MYSNEHLQTVLTTHNLTDLCRPGLSSLPTGQPLTRRKSESGEGPGWIISSPEKFFAAVDQWVFCCAHHCLNPWEISSLSRLKFIAFAITSRWKSSVGTVSLGGGGDGDGGIVLCREIKKALKMWASTVSVHWQRYELDWKIYKWAFWLQNTVLASISYCLNI